MKLRLISKKTTAIAVVHLHIPSDGLKGKTNPLRV